MARILALQKLKATAKHPLIAAISAVSVEIGSRSCLTCPHNN